MSFFRSLTAKADRASEPRIPSGDRVYAIGDVHGRLDLLNALLDRVETDIRTRRPARNFLVFLGDLIDRGPDSAQVVERLRTYESAGAKLIFLSGNHEEVLLRLLRGESGLIRDWLRFGGEQCARSYGIDPASLKRSEPDRAVEILNEKVPAAHKSFLSGFADTFRVGDYLFVHAGLRPGVPLAEQSQADLRWIRQPFLESSDDHGFVIVHGHTITGEVDVRDNRIGLDTGAYRTGVLTAMGIEGAERWYLQTSEDGPQSRTINGDSGHISGRVLTPSPMAAFQKERCSE